MSGYYGKKIACRRIWQPGYFDDILRPHDNVWEYVRYIAMNPVEAGLVKDPRDYPFTGSSTHSRDDLREHIRICCEINDDEVPYLEGPCD
jgi:hypothetical protein